MFDVRFGAVALATVKLTVLWHATPWRLADFLDEGDNRSLWNVVTCIKSIQCDSKKAVTFLMLGYLPPRPQEACNHNVR